MARQLALLKQQLDDSINEALKNKNLLLNAKMNLCGNFSQTDTNELNDNFCNTFIQMNNICINTE